jgi:NADH:ubiquinone oxidoreductase subunit D
MINVIIIFCAVGGEGWPERLMQKMMYDKNALSFELREQEVDMIEKRNTYGQYDVNVLELRNELSILQNSIRDLEVKVLTDERARHELNESKQDAKNKLSALEEKETNKEMANLLIEIKGNI